MDDKLLLNYHDAVVYESDLSILDSPTAWLNDSCIHFQMNRLQFKQQECRSVDGSDLKGTDLFLDPSVISYLMHQCDEDDEDFRGEISNLHRTWDLSSKSYKRVFVPINDQFSQSHAAFTRPGGGSHWSLLLWTIASNNDIDLSIPTFYHFDSSSGYNASAASAVSRKLMKVLHCNLPASSDEIMFHVKECITPQQKNGFDCGVYLLGFAEGLTSVHDSAPADHCCQEKYEAALQVATSGSDFASILRGKIAADIRGLISQR